MAKQPISIFSSEYGWKPPTPPLSELPPSPAARALLEARIKLSGRVSVRQFREGVLIKERQGPNLIVNVGFAAVAGLVGGLAVDPFQYLALGSGTTAAASSDTALETEITTNGGERALASVSRVTTDSTDDTLQLVKTFMITGALAVTEIGVFNHAVTGLELCRHVFAEDTLANLDAYEVTYQLNVG